MKWSNLLIVVLSVILMACGKNKEEVGYQARIEKSAKRGVAFNLNTMEDAVLLAPYITWDYNWSESMQDDVLPFWLDGNGVEFCPMTWSRNYNANRIRAYVAAHPSTKYLLGFNEPNLTDQANMTPAKAAEYWPTVVALAKELNLKLVAPALNYGTLAGYHDPIKWMDEFLACPGVSIDDIDVIALHCYMPSSGGIIDFVKKFSKYNKPIWMTEFCAWDSDAKSPSSVEAQIDYMCEVLNFFEQSPLVERYAWFIPRYKTPGTYPYMQMLTNSSPLDPSPIELTELGQIYCKYSVFDPKAFVRFPLNASDFTRCQDDIHIRVSSDPQAAGLMVYDMAETQWTEYQVYVETPIPSLSIRTCSYSGASVALYVDDVLVTVQTIPGLKDMSAWQAPTFDVNLTTGRHTIKLQCMDGDLNLSQISEK